MHQGPQQRNNIGKICRLQILFKKNALIIDKQTGGGEDRRKIITFTNIAFSFTPLHTWLFLPKTTAFFNILKFF